MSEETTITGPIYFIREAVTFCRRCFILTGIIFWSAYAYAAVNANYVMKVGFNPFEVTFTNEVFYMKQLQEVVEAVKGSK